MRFPSLAFASLTRVVVTLNTGGLQRGSDISFCYTTRTASSRTKMAAEKDGKPSLPPKSYCAAAEGHEWHGPYHDTQYGFPIRKDDNALFERLVLEINQAGLSWLTILKKQENFREAYDGFDINAVASYGAEDCERLRQDAGIIRNKLKINAAIFNAQQIQKLQKSHGSFELWLDSHHPLTKPEWVDLFKKTFKFTGGEITSEFLTSLGYLPGAHVKSCPVFDEIARLEPPWMSAPKKFHWGK